MFRVNWVGRNANSVAHTCAGMGLISDQSQIWFDYISERLLDVAATNCNHASN